MAFEEVGISDWKKYVKIDKKFKRPLDVKSLCGDFEKAEKKLGWTPKTNFKDLVKLMVKEDLKDAKKIIALIFLKMFKIREFKIIKYFKKSYRIK